MPNPAQTNLLDSLIGLEGIYYETIRDYARFNLGTKILYLERAINQSCQEFLKSLDKVYIPTLMGEAKSTTLDFIRALKTINDLCFNNDINFDEHGTRRALDHYFGRLGPIDSIAFHHEIKKIINADVSELSKHHEVEVLSQKKDRENDEFSIYRQTRWRVELDLPGNQMPQQVPYFFQPITENRRNLYSLAHILHVPVENLLELNPALQDELIAQPYSVNRLIREAHLRLTDLLALEPVIRAELLTQSQGVAWLVNNAHVPFPDLLALEPALRTELLTRSQELGWLVNETEASFADLLSLKPALRTELLTRAGDVSRLVNEVNVSFADLLALDPALLTELLTRSRDVVQLVKKMHVPFEQLSSLSVPQIRTLMEHPELLSNQYLQP